MKKGDFRFCRESFLSPQTADYEEKLVKKPTSLLCLSGHVKE
ncbi:MAG: hypothetical protein ACLTQL_14410 [Eisenbergiella sp.]